MRVAFYTLGCKVNQYDTSAMQAVLAQRGHEIVPFEESADAYVINTCTVTQESDRKARQLIGRARRQNPQAAVILCGCYAQRDAAHVLALDGVDAVAGTLYRGRIEEVILGARHGEKHNFVEAFTPQADFEETCGAVSERARAHVKVQEGCDRHCTYCIIPRARGPIRSRTQEGVAREVQQMARQGHREVVLTGIRLASYGRERGGTLMDAIHAAAGTDIARIRLGSLDPDEMTDELIDRMAGCEKLCPHFHLSLQSGSDTVLHRMARRYTTAEFAHVVQRIRARFPRAAFSTDVMVGFVGETDEEFCQTCEFVQRIGFMKLHVFPYSRRAGTAADRMTGHLPQNVKQLRARELIRIGEKLEAQFAQSCIGQMHEVIFEQQVNGAMEGHAENYLRVRAPLDVSALSQLRTVTLTGSSGALGLCKDAGTLAK